MKKPLFSLILILGFSSCLKVEDDGIGFEPKFIIEGLIEEGEFPIVQVTHNIPNNYVIDTAQLEHLIVRTATVTVRSSNDEEILTLTRDREVFPYYFYVGRRLKGVAGERYHLEVQYSDINLSATTDIPPDKPVIESVWFEELDENKILPFISLPVNTDAPKGNYRFYTKLPEQSSYYTTTPKGFREKYMTTPNATLSLLRNRGFFENDEENSMYYKKGDIIQIKVSNMTDTSYELWNQAAQQSIQFSFLAYTRNFSGNINGPATGIWYGTNPQTATVHTE